MANVPTYVYINTPEEFENRLSDLGYSLSTFCGKEIKGVVVRSRNTYRRAIAKGRMTDETYRNLVDAVGPTDARFLVLGEPRWVYSNSDTQMYSSKEMMLKTLKAALPDISKSTRKKKIVKDLTESLADICDEYGISKKKIARKLLKK